MEEMVQMFMGVKSAQIAQQYAFSVQKLAMNSSEQALGAIEEMLPEDPPVVPKGEFLDVFA
ncbi:MAG: putative motility protein [Oscillospiraceae bacterium]|nr:putative motility protein [Oscillospiraceae bacterium]